MAPMPPHGNAEGGAPKWSESFFPKVPKVDKCLEAHQLRDATKKLIIGHIICLILAFAFVSVFTAAGQVVYIAALFSLH